LSNIWELRSNYRGLPQAVLHALFLLYSAFPQILLGHSVEVWYNYLVPEASDKTERLPSRNMGAYDHPLYYEVAFSYQEVERQVDYFEEIIRKFCHSKAKRFLDIGCGPSPQLREIARRGYEAVGLDLNPKMLRYLRRRAADEDLRIETILADMRDFNLRKRCDFAITLSGSLHVSSNEEFMKHLACVANALNYGGIYLLENVTLGLKPRYHQRWTKTRGHIRVDTDFESVLVDPLRQSYEERLTLRVHDQGRSRKFESTTKIKRFAPQEFRSLVESSGHFAFLGFFRHLSLEPLARIEDDNIVLMQKLRNSWRRAMR
jgi:SAM-dependent methyltransferase